MGTEECNSCIAHVCDFLTRGFLYEYSLLCRPFWLSGWCAGVEILSPRGMGSIPVVISYLVRDGGQWRDSVSSARVDPALNGYRVKSVEGKQEGCVKALDGWPPAPHCTSWLKGHDTETSTAGLDLKGLVSSYFFFFTFFLCSNCHYYIYDQWENTYPGMIEENT